MTSHDEDQCCFCNSKNTTLHEENSVIPVSPKMVWTEEVPYIAIIIGCVDCGKQWTDYRDEDRRHAVLVAHGYIKD